MQFPELEYSRKKCNALENLLTNVPAEKHMQRSASNAKTYAILWLLNNYKLLSFDQ